MKIKLGGLRRVRSATWRGAAIGIAWALICWCLNGTSLIRALENWALDGSFVIRGPRPSTANVIIVAMDEQSLGEIDKPFLFLSPELAQVVDYLHDQGAAAIGVDFVLTPGRKTMKYLLPPDGPGNAELMGQAVGRAGNVVLPQWLRAGREPLRPLFEWRAPSEYPRADLGFVDLSIDTDSSVRRQELRMWDDRGGGIPSMHLALLMKAGGLPEEWLDKPQLELDGKPIPLDADGCLRINYVGPPGSIRRVPFHRVLADARGAHDPADEPLSYRGAIVLVGSTVADLKDSYPTPYSNQTIPRLLLLGASRPAEMMPGVEVNANVVATLLDRAFITTPWWLSTLPWLVVVGAAMGAILVRCTLETGALVAVAHHLAWRTWVVAAFCLHGWQVESIAMLMLGTVLYATIFALRWRWIRRMMGMVKSEAVARALNADPAKLDLRGEQRDITVMFCDIRNFTPFAEHHSPQEVVRLLNAFFSAAVPAIEAEGGTLMQYVGDAFMAVFGAPARQDDHAASAVRAAVEVVGRVHQFRDRWKDLGAEDFRIGIGVHTGRAVVGTVGSPHRLDYTAVGDTVNTAARIESATKELHVEVLISRATFEALPEGGPERTLAASEPRALSVKGKREVLQVYAVG
ncbi:MAG: adenylate/guanylate cyclase domain-containing protein [Thermoguttaceae bacterium]|jgi:adenylate cyclase